MTNPNSKQVSHQTVVGADIGYFDMSFNYAAIK